MISLETVTSLASACFWISSVMPGFPFCEETTRGTRVELWTLATSLIRLSALGTAQLSSAPTNGEVETPEPLPYELEPPDGCALCEAVPDVDALVEVSVCGVSGESTLTLADVLSLLSVEAADDVVLDEPEA